VGFAHLNIRQHDVEGALPSLATHASQKLANSLLTGGYRYGAFRLALILSEIRQGVILDLGPIRPKAKAGPEGFTPGDVGIPRRYPVYSCFIEEI